MTTCPTRMTSKSVMLAMSIAGTLIAPSAHADLFKCTANGKVQYQQTPCTTGEEKALDDSTRRMKQREREERERIAKRESEALLKGGSVGGDEGERKSRAEQAMRSYFDGILIDPSSAQFRNIQVFLDVPGSTLRTTGSKTTPLVDVVCGEVNSKNRMGGYVGFRYFYWDSDSKKVFGASDVKGLDSIMEDIARRTCSRLG